MERLVRAVDARFERTEDFECSIDGGPFEGCDTLVQVEVLTAGQHTFAVRAIDLALNVDPTPAIWTWIIDDMSAPDTEITLGPAPKIELGDSRLSSEVYDTPIENLDLSVRVFNSLKRAGITTVGEVIELLDKGQDAVMSIRNFGDKSLDELVEKMQDKGYMSDGKSGEGEEE